MKLEVGKSYTCRDGTTHMARSKGSFGGHPDNNEATYSIEMRGRTYWADGPHAGKVYHATRLKWFTKDGVKCTEFIPGYDPLDVVFDIEEHAQLDLFREEL